MKTFTVKSANPKENITKPHFFVLCKGMNSGKPLDQRCPNSFCIISDSEKEKEQLYWVSFALWRSNAFYPYLMGSVIPYIRINDFRQLVEDKLKIVDSDLGGFAKITEQLKLIELREKQFLENLKLMEDLKKAYVYKYFNKNR
jgi:hypothetical protein